jgi:cyclophilin family peptidyl-prolyl cis-trans isomerase
MNTRFLTGLVLVILIAAGIHFYLNSRPDAYFNTYGVEAASSTDSFGSPVVPPTDSGSQSVSVTDQSSVTTNPINTNTSQKNFMNKVTLVTNKGTIVFETYDADAPKTVRNFITLANKGLYNGRIFHRVIPNFMIQGGDPTGTGMSGPGYQFADELNPATPSYKAGYVRGTVAMANSGPNTNGSQFFIMQKDNLLPNKYSIFGRVLSGMDVVDAIVAVKTGDKDKPVENVVMTKVTVEGK